MFKAQNPKIDCIWSLCHIVSLIIKHGLLEITVFAKLFKMVKQCYEYFTNSITDQLFDGICYEHEFKHDTAHNAIDKAFNNLYKPCVVIMNNYHHVLTTLRFINLNTNDEKAKNLYKYYSNIQSLLLVNICCAFTTKCQDLINLLGIDLVDIISCCDEITEFETIEYHLMQIIIFIK